MNDMEIRGRVSALVRQLSNDVGWVRLSAPNANATRSSGHPTPVSTDNCRVSCLQAVSACSSKTR